jgi:phosphoadenylyl-sulfate reductase (thioredoxin)
VTGATSARRNAAVDIDAATRALDGEPPLAILTWAATHFERLTFATGFGAEGCLLIDVIARARLPIDVFTLDTGVLFDETYALWRVLEAHYGIAIRAVRPEHTIAEQAAAHGHALWTRAPDRCCELRKSAPLRATLADFDAWITGIRRDQTPDRASAAVVERDRKFGLVKVNPLVGCTADDVWAYIRANDVPHSPLHDRGYPSIGCAPCTSPVVPGENLRAGRWRGVDKTECGLHTREKTS